MNKKQTNLSYALVIAVLAIAAAVLFYISYTHPTTPSNPYQTTTTTMLPIPTSMVLNQTEVQAIFNANGNYSSSSAAKTTILNNQTIPLDMISMQFGFSQYGSTYTNETIEFPTANYTGYNLSTSYSRSVSNYNAYLSRLPEGISSTNQTGVLNGMTYTLFTSNTTTGAIQLHLIGYSGVTSVSMAVTGYATSIKPGTGNTILAAVAQTI